MVLVLRLRCIGVRNECIYFSPMLWTRLTTVVTSGHTTLIYNREHIIWKSKMVLQRELLYGLPCPSKNRNWFRRLCIWGGFELLPYQTMQPTTRWQTKSCFPITNNWY